MASCGVQASQIAAIEYVNALFCDALPSTADLTSALDEVLSSHESIKHQLDQQLTAVTQEAPVHIERSLKYLESAATIMKKFKSEEDTIVGDVCNSDVDMSPLVSKLTTLTSQIRELQKYTHYLRCIAHIEDLSSDIQSALLIGTYERAVDQFGAMVRFAQAMRDTRCQNLFRYVRETITYWYRILLEKLCREFDEAVKAWQWPFITASVKEGSPVQKANELRDLLGPRFQYLVNLQVPTEFLSEELSNPFTVKMPADIPPLLLPMQVLLKPFHKRFVFHFFKNEKTNRYDKPEWYFTQTLTWINDHQNFLKTKIQPELDKAGLHHVDAVIEFIRGLISLVRLKIYDDVEQLTTDNLLAHLVDETLTFQRELRTTYDYPDALPGCLHVLSQSESFRRWISVEKKSALEQMDKMLSSETRWQCQSRIDDVDDSKVSECGETIMTMLSSITERYKLLPSVNRQLQFAQLQLELLDDFRVRLVQIRSELQNLGTTPVCHDYCSILNTVLYVIGILHQWNNQPFFVKLQYYMQRTKKQDSAANESAFGLQLDRTVHENDSGSGKLDDSVTQNSNGQNETTSDSLNDQESYDDLDVSLFDEVINLYQILQDSMLADIESYVFDDVKARSKPYRNEKWLALPSHKDYLSLALSNSACEMLLVLKNHLHQMELQLSAPLFSLFWQRLAGDLNNFLYKQLILANHFNEGGAAQLQFDMTRNFFPLFGAYTTKPENFFKDVKESCLVLTLSAGSILLLREVLDIALHRSHESAPVTDPIAALQDIGVNKLELHEVEYLLSRRVDVIV